MDSKRVEDIVNKIASKSSEESDRTANRPALDGETITDLMNSVSGMRGDDVWQNALKFDSILTMLTRDDLVPDSYLKVWKRELASFRDAQDDLRKTAKKAMENIAKVAGF